MKTSRRFTLFAALVLLLVAAFEACAQDTSRYSTIFQNCAWGNSIDAGQFSYGFSPGNSVTLTPTQLQQISQWDTRYGTFQSGDTIAFPADLQHVAVDFFFQFHARDGWHVMPAWFSQSDRMVYLMPEITGDIVVDPDGALAVHGCAALREPIGAVLALINGGIAPAPTYAPQAGDPYRCDPVPGHLYLHNCYYIPASQATPGDPSVVWPTPAPSQPRG